MSVLSIDRYTKAMDLIREAAAKGSSIALVIVHTRKDALQPDPVQFMTDIRAGGHVSGLLLGLELTRIQLLTGIDMAPAPRTELPARSG